ncbi:SHOCT domain-containing protein [Natranaeroarchaeum sulfidigenes]|uniref:Putative membrane protein n=1 Tax=Natranaeroarchaeum sulfidigenes TaxID=2784880 RepID=A0A897MQY6_9EURY|nr:SHOCT domain-containing protein [Natranaeroarchaeum sulfidigenes]QSG02398.1 putative membrane protein [Natranaeroarchaeum sulfidigenes]
MVADPDEGLVTDLMLGLMVAFGFDIILLLGVFWIAGFVPFTAFLGGTVLIVGWYAAWIGYRWWALRTAETTEADPVKELKGRYASGELTEDEFETKLETVIDDQNAGDAVGRDEVTERGQREQSAGGSEH